METLTQDIRYAVRGLRKAPGFTLVALLTLALGIGVNSSIFSVVNAILFRPLPVAQPNELVDIYGHESTSNSHETHSYPNYVTYRSQTTTLTDLIGYSNFFAHLSIEGSSDLVVGELVSDNYFRSLGIRPALGRIFTPQEASAFDASAYAVLSDRFWKTKFAGAPDVVGKTFKMNGIVYTVLGVAPPDFLGMIPAVTAQMWIPLTMVEKVEPFGNQRVSGPIHRRQPLRAAWAALDVAQGPHEAGRHRCAGARRVRGARAPAGRGVPGDHARRSGSASCPRATCASTRTSTPRSLPPACCMVAAVGLVLVVACANLANLMLARAAGRRREIALRAALGAERSRIVRQLLTESVLLALLGGAIALPLAAGLSQGHHARAAAAAHRPRPRGEPRLARARLHAARRRVHRRRVRADPRAALVASGSRAGAQGRERRVHAKAVRAA